MQFVRNKRQTSLTIKKYVGYDKARKRSAVATVGTIRLVPEVPTSVPAAIAGELTSEQLVEAKTTLGQIRAERKCVALQSAVSTASAGMNTVAQEVGDGQRLDPKDLDRLRIAMGTLTQALAIPPPAPPPLPSNDLVVAALMAVNAVVDAMRGGLSLSAVEAMELQMQLALIGELMSEQTAPVASTSAIPQHHGTDRQAAAVTAHNPSPERAQ